MTINSGCLELLRSGSGGVFMQRPNVQKRDDCNQCYDNAQIAGHGRPQSGLCDCQPAFMAARPLCDVIIALQLVISSMPEANKRHVTGCDRPSSGQQESQGGLLQVVAPQLGTAPQPGTASQPGVISWQPPPVGLRPAAMTRPGA
eukprot:CAMPEP_0115393662 /NCGR_PEP_ID=MMETSP0271-20121206/11868_1 /TAXON_ID=71861 /ORGANISM="Scrippsiella trochoidea, Strain CCMP3099" /LENGTH=144 /DNA_ID=CAMNT_0002817313 /DNA_START=750 /DNA_END=1182 /DNA_ORIENTATION=+